MRASTASAFAHLITDPAVEVAVGLGSGGNGWIETFNNKASSYAHMDWSRLSWNAYNTSSGEGRVACADVDGDDLAELVLGLDSNGEGWVEVKEDRISGYAHLAWIRIAWAAYNAANGETWPSAGNLR